MLLYHHLLYHPKRATLPTMTVIPCERATLTEVAVFLLLLLLLS